MLTLITPLAWINGRTFWALSSVAVTRKGRRAISLRSVAGMTAEAL